MVIKTIKIHDKLDNCLFLNTKMIQYNDYLIKETRFTMKPIITTLLLSFITALGACNNNNNLDDIDYEQLKELPYYEYLNNNNPVITIDVEEYGKMTLQLFPEVSPNTVNNFLTYVLDNQFENSTFHRIIKGFMVQGGMVNNTQRPIAGEFSSNGFENNLKHDRGVISMARTFMPNSATSQFFIMDKKSPHLDGGYASFGALISGFDVLDKIASVKTNSGDAPLVGVIIKSIKVNLNGYKLGSVVYV